MGLTDFSPKTQDLIAVELIRSVGVIDKIKAGDIAGAMSPVARKWAALPKGSSQANYYPAQPYEKYEVFLDNYHAAGGTGK